MHGYVRVRGTNRSLWLTLCKVQYLLLLSRSARSLKNTQFVRVCTKKAGYSLQRSHFFESQSWCHLFSHLFSHAIFSHLFSRSRAIVIFICLCRKVQRMILRNIPKDNTRMSIHFLPIFPFLSYFASPVRLPVIAKYYREFPKSLFYDSNILPLTPGLPVPGRDYECRAKFSI